MVMFTVEAVFPPLTAPPMRAVAVEIQLSRAVAGQTRHAVPVGAEERQTVGQSKSAEHQQHGTTEGGRQRRR
ncbi:hypothetical protein ACIRPK_33005 [Kitasatospora sp. NPDC101801]|uniref:hypothetical protein n=1 Tax=Kitasatospora sp. NPDC101801 TaxID=3364103 RepID=UPI0038231212